jgi:hypothetical protein
MFGVEEVDVQTEEEPKREPVYSAKDKLINHGLNLLNHKSSNKHKFLMNYLAENGDYEKWKSDKEIVVDSSTRVFEQIPTFNDLNWVKPSKNPPQLY